MTLAKESSSSLLLQAKLATERTSKEMDPVAGAAPAPEAAQESAAEARSEGQLSAMKATGLKALCKERGLSGKGKKAELVDRLLG